MFEPSVLGQYTLMSRLAAGGMAELFIAHDDGEAGPRLVVIKRILPEYANDVDFIKMFVDEARIVGTLKHRNIVGLLDFGSVEDSYYIAMEYIEGFDVATLDDAARERGTPLTIEESVFIVEQACRALVYAHTRKDVRGRALDLVHRDISPENLIVSSTGLVTVTDFGIAKAASRLSVTRVGMTKGKLGYMSPESMFHKQIDHRHDVFTSGIVLWQLLAGRSLLGDQNERGVIAALSGSGLPLVTAHNKDVDPALAEIVAKALALNPDDRFQNALEFGDALKGWLASRKFKDGETLLAKRISKLFGPELERRKVKLKRVMEERELLLPADMNRDRTLQIDITDVDQEKTQGAIPALQVKEKKSPRLLIAAIAGSVALLVVAALVVVKLLG